MRKITIVKSDSKVTVDGVSRKVDLSTLDPNIHAIEWDIQAKRGNIEYVSPPRTKQLKSSNDFSPYKPYVVMWDAATPVPDTPQPQPTQAEWIDRMFDSPDRNAAALVELAAHGGLTERELIQRIKTRMGA